MRSLFRPSPFPFPVHIHETGTRLLNLRFLMSTMTSVVTSLDAEAATIYRSEVSRLMRWLQLGFDVHSTGVRLLIGGHQGHSDVTR